MSDNNFVVKLILILIGYTSVLFPFYCLIQYVDRKCKENDKSFSYNSKWWGRLLRSFAVGHPEYLLLIGTTLHSPSSTSQSKIDDLGDENLLISANGENIIRQKHIIHKNKFNRNAITITKSYQNKFVKDCIRVLVFFFGIQITLVSMGFFQERIMTQGYLLIENPLILEKFSDAQFLVFANRIIGCLLSGTYLFYDWKKQPVHIPPLYTHSLTSLSNTISSWCQYEALKYVSFPTQTVCKASKIIPTMLMGRLLRKERYSHAQYGLAILLVTGASIFFLSMNSGNSFRLNSNIVQDHSTTFSGLILMAGYLTLDAFTPNYQKKLMEAKVSCCQMMFYVNVFSAFLCFVSLLQQLTFFSSLSFLFSHYDIIRDCLFLSIGSACGQVFIYLTIEEFGPVVLSVMMTLRQIFSIILSALYFSHPISFFGAFGLSIVFGSIFADSYRKYRCRTKNHS